MPMRAHTPEEKAEFEARGVVFNNPSHPAKSFFEPPCTFSGHTQVGYLEFGAFTSCQGGRFNNCTIGRYCSFAPGVIISPPVHPVGALSSSPAFYGKGTSDKWGRFRQEETPFDLAKKQDTEQRVSIGHDVWVGQNVVIMDGVTIGTGAVIGASAVVTKDVPAYAIVAGVPARILRYRFEESVREALLASEWWRKSAYDILASGLDVSSPEGIIDNPEALNAIPDWAPEVVET